MKTAIEPIPESIKRNYCKIFALSFLVLLIVASVFIADISSKLRSQKVDNDNQAIGVLTPSNLPTPETVEKNVEYPSQAFMLAKGTASLASNDLFEQKYFLLSLKPYLRGSSIDQEKTYKIPLSGMDSVSDPKIAHGEKYGCVTIGASGYSGYYIFTLPDGNEVEKGVQYSQCIEWIDGHRVVIAEHVYNTFDYSYYILDLNTGSKKVLSTFSQQ